jgi:hypothetical protein
LHAQCGSLLQTFVFFGARASFSFGSLWPRRDEKEASAGRSNLDELVTCSFDFTSFNSLNRLSTPLPLFYCYDEGAFEAKEGEK